MCMIRGRNQMRNIDTFPGRAAARRRSSHTARSANCSIAILFQAHSSTTLKMSATYQNADYYCNNCIDLAFVIAHALATLLCDTVDTETKRHYHKNIRKRLLARQNIFQRPKSSCDNRSDRDVAPGEIAQKIHLIIVTA